MIPSSKQGAVPEPEAMRFHGPGWTLDFTVRDDCGDEVEPGALYQLWAPQDGVIVDPYSYADYQAAEWTPRLRWASCWQSADGDDGDFRDGDSATAVLALFPAEIRSAFEDAVAGAQVRS